jgi:hypothetical protein
MAAAVSTIDKEIYQRSFHVWHVTILGSNIKQTNLPGGNAICCMFNDKSMFPLFGNRSQICLDLHIYKHVLVSRYVQIDLDKSVTRSERMD